MENLVYHNSRQINFIKILFRFLLVFFIISLVLLFILKINDSVIFKEGEVYSTNPQTKITAPSEARVLRISVTEGQKIKKGDTLIILQNKKLTSEYNTTLQEVKTIDAKINIFQSLLNNTTNKKQALEQLGVIQSEIYSSDKDKSGKEAEAILNKLKVYQEQNMILAEKQKSDSMLLAKGAISKLEATESRNKTLDFTKQQIEVLSTLEQKKFEYGSLNNNYEKAKNSIRMELLASDNQVVNYSRDIVTLRAELKNKEYSLNYLRDEVARLFVLSPISGTVSNLYNTKQTTEFLNKGDLLAIVAPDTEEFYAKITMPEKELAYIKAGQQVNLKVDAYYYYKFGAIKGVIEHISPSDINKSFYATIKLEPFNSNIQLKAGYKLKGEIIIEKMKVYKYIFKKLFKKIGNGF